LKFKKSNIETVIDDDAEMVIQNKKTKKQPSFSSIIIIVSVLTIFLNIFVFQLAKVNGNSMLPTLEDSEILLLYKLNPKIERGDIVVFRQNGGVLIKRVIALPNETIVVNKDSIEINGEKIEDYVNTALQNGGELSENFQVPDGEYICLGDNRNNSHDSRAFGSIKEEDIIGVVVLRFFPFALY
jgi:signal peptidase I